MTARQELAEELGCRVPCVVGTKFGHGSLHVGDRIFAFTRTDLSAAMKLPQERIAELLNSREVYLLRMGERTMRDWLVVPDIAETGNLPLLREAMAYVASLPASPRQRAKKKAAKKKTAKKAAKVLAKKATKVAVKKTATKKAATKKIVGKKKTKRR